MDWNWVREMDAVIADVPLEDPGYVRFVEERRAWMESELREFDEKWGGVMRRRGDAERGRHGEQEQEQE